MSKHNDTPIIEEKTQEELDEIIRAITTSSLPDSVKSFVINSVNSALWFPHILQKKNISLNRLKKMIFGKSYKSKEKQASSSNNTVQASTGSDNDKASDAAATPPESPASTDEIEAFVNANAEELASSEIPQEKKS